MVLNAAVQMLREADELKQKILKFKNGTSMLQERTLWITQEQLQKLYQKVLVLDLDYALDKKVEQDLWNVGFKQQIEALQAISKDKKNQLRSEGQAMLSWVLQAAAGFYLCLLHQICTTLKLDLPFRRRASLLGCVEGWGAGEAEAGARMPPPAAARYICQHCLVHLGDLARYRQQLRVAHTFYRHALVVSAHSGQPYNQLALVAWRRGRRLAALYWHVRSLLVRAPFPPAPANLARTLAAAAAAGRDGRALPVLGESPPASPPPRPASPRLFNSSRLDSHTYINEFIRVVHIIYTAEQLDTASELVDNLNSSLTALIATNSFDSMTLIKMSCVIMWLVHATTEGHAIDGTAMTATEATAALLADTLAAGALLALLLPAYTVDEPLQEALPAVCVWAQWAWCARDASGHVRRAFDGAAWIARPQLWPALAHTLNAVARTPQADAAHPPHHDQYWNVPLPEDEELVGFTPLEGAHSSLRFSNHAAWDTYGGRTPDDSDADTHVDVATGSLHGSPEFERRLRAHRLVELGKRLAEQYPEHITHSEEEEEGVLEGEGGGEEGGRTRFVARSEGGEQLSRALAALLAARDNEPQPPRPPPPPLVISEADFREKVREKRVGILKPQGSLERAREERALANTADNEEEEEAGEAEPVGEAGGAVEEEKREARRTRVNIAMAAIMRKQEEGNKQVKFVTPPATPELSTESETQTSDKPKVIQPKVIKSLANLPVGRKTGGILSLKDKSAGYPHLVNAEPEKKTIEEKKEIKQTSPQTQQRRQDLHHQPQQNWPTPYSESVRMNYNIQNPTIGYNSNFNAINNQGIRLPVVNPKEIDVRTAAIQKQNSRHDLFQDGNKIGNQGYQMSGDKKNFLNDLPPRFANQFRHWQQQAAQENQHGENKFRDDNFKANFSQPPPQPRPNWMNQTQQETLTPTPWWKPDSHTFLNYSAPPMNIPNFYSHLNPNVNLNLPYQNQMSQFNMPGQSVQQKPDINYMQSTIGQQMPTLQNLVAPPNINPTMNLSTFPQTVGYDSNMYPQFNKFQPHMKSEKQQGGFEGGKEFPIGQHGYNPNVLEMQQRNVSFGETFNNETSSNNMDHVRSMEGVGANTYSLFSGAPEPSAAMWGSSQHSHQSLWSGPGPSPLERLLEQQKQMRQPQPPPH